MRLLHCAVLAASLLVSGSAAAQKPAPAAPPSKRGVFDLSAVEVAPRIINRAEVERLAEDAFADELEPAGGSGLVSIRFYVAVDGTPSGVVVGDSSVDPRIARAATRVALAMRFRPAQVNGRPVRVLVRIPFQYAVPPKPPAPPPPSKN